MKVVFKNTGEIKEVADGYARNYLLPRGLAVSATLKAIEEALRIQKETKEHVSAQDNQWNALKAVLTTTTLIINAKANADGTLFGALSAAVIVGTLYKEKQIELKPVWLHLAAPIKQVGVHAIEVRLPNGTQTTFTLDVKAK